MLRDRRVLAAAGLLLLWLGVSVWLALWFSARIRDWSVMTDELQYAKLAIAIADTQSPLPRLHDTSVSVLNQLYPLLIAPLYGTLSSPDAFRAVHALNAVVMTSAALPAYLLGRQVLPRAWSLGVAALSVVVPWMVLTGFLMTEVVAYPAFLWAILALQHAIAAPSPRRDLLAVLALGIAVLARAQLAVLVLVMPLAIVGHELGRALSSSGRVSTRRKLVSGVREAVRRHAKLAALYAVGAVAVAIVAAFDSVSRLLGTYSVTIEQGSLLPSGVWSAAARHIDVVAIGCGVVPLVLGGGWMISAAVRPRSRREHALATLFLVTVALLTVEAASYGVRFGSADVVRDRYLFYVVPLLLVGSAAALEGTRRRGVAVGAALVTAFFAATVPLLTFTPSPGVSVDSPASVLNDVLVEQSGTLGTGTFVALGGVLLGIVLVLAVLLAPRAPLALLLFVVLLSFSVLTLRAEVDRIKGSDGLSGRPLAAPPGQVLDWVDTVLPEGATAALIPFPVSTAWDTSAIRWWDVEFWNRSVTRTYVAPDGNFTYTPFPSRTLELDWATGEDAGTSAAPSFVVTAPGDPRFLLAGREHAANVGMTVRAVDRPYRAVWMSRGLETDGWTRPGRPATIRVFDRSNAQPELVTVRISVQAPGSAPARYRIATDTEARIAALSTDEERAEEISICVPAGTGADVTLTALSSTVIEGAQLSPEIEETRSVGVGVGTVSLRRHGRACEPPLP